MHGEVFIELASPPFFVHMPIRQDKRHLFKREIPEIKSLLWKKINDQKGIKVSLFIKTSQKLHDQEG